MAPRQRMITPQPSQDEISSSSSSLVDGTTGRTISRVSTAAMVHAGVRDNHTAISDDDDDDDDAIRSKPLLISATSGLNGHGTVPSTMCATVNSSSSSSSTDDSFKIEIARDRHDIFNIVALVRRGKDSQIMYRFLRVMIGFYLLFPALTRFAWTVCASSVCGIALCNCSDTNQLGFPIHISRA
jgi:hypothetical protein